MNFLKKIFLLGLLAALPVFAQTNTGLQRYSNTSVINNGNVCWESTAGAGPDVCLIRSSAGVLSVVQGDGVTGATISLGSPVISIANEGATGTTVNKLAKLTGAPSTAILAGTGDNKNGVVVGVVVGGAGITGSAQVTVAGTVGCAFDATAVTAGDFVTVSGTVAGKCHDFGATIATDGSQVLGRALASGNASTTQNIFLTPGVANAAGLNITAGKSLAVTSIMTLTGTDSQTYTFPTTSATIARTDAANTFTGHQTIEGVTSTGATGTNLLVFATTPTLTTPVIGVATGTSLALSGTASLTLGTSGSLVGQVILNNGTSGTVTLQPATGALSTTTFTLPPISGNLAPILSCGSTGTGNQTCSPSAATAKAQIYNGESTLATNAATITFPNAFTSTTTYFCVANDVTTRANPVQMIPASASTATITDTTGASDVVQWVCLGN